jgi:hypothetical protein
VVAGSEEKGGSSKTRRKTRGLRWLALEQKRGSSRTLVGLPPACSRARHCRLQPCLRAFKRVTAVCDVKPTWEHARNAVESLNGEVSELLTETIFSYGTFRLRGMLDGTLEPKSSSPRRLAPEAQ